MPINAYKVGPGLFTLGVTPLDVSCQVTSLTITPTENVETEEAIHALCGDDLPQSETATYTYRASGTLLQDLAAAGVVDYTWTNEGAEVPFTYVPNTVVDRAVTGTVRVIPLAIGGDVTARATSDFDWACIGKPVFGPAA